MQNALNWQPCALPTLAAMFQQEVGATSCIMLAWCKHFLVKQQQQCCVAYAHHQMPFSCVSVGLAGKNTCVCTTLCCTHVAKWNRAIASTLEFFVKNRKLPEHRLWLWCTFSWVSYFIVHWNLVYSSKMWLVHKFTNY